MTKNYPLNEQPSGTSKRARLPVNFKRNAIPAFMVLGIILSLWFGMVRIENAYQIANENVYNSFYQAAFKFAEKRNSVSDHVLISVEGAREISRLEVLTVSGSEYVIKNADENDNNISWLEVQGTGVFTVDLSAGEFIVDSKRQYVLVKVPKPVLTECTVSGTGERFWRDGSFFYNLFNNGSVADGVRLSQAQMSEGRVKLEDSMRRSRRFNEASKDAAVNMIESLVRQWNPNVPDLQIEVEFIENP